MTRHLWLTFAMFVGCQTTPNAPPPPTTTTSTTATTTTTVPVPAPTTTAPPAVVEAPAPRPRSAAVAGGGAGSVLACIKRYESGGNYQARNGAGHSGAYQFDAATWRSVGGSGEAADASPAEQDARAGELYRRRGLQPWSVREKCRWG